MCSSCVPPKINSANTSVAFEISKKGRENDGHESPFKEVKSKLLKLRKMFTTVVLDRKRKQKLRDRGERELRPEMLGVSFSRQRKAVPGSTETAGSKFSFFKKKPAKLVEPSSSTDAGPKMELTEEQATSSELEGNTPNQTVAKKHSLKPTLGGPEKPKTQKEKQSPPAIPEKSKDPKDQKQVSKKPKLSLVANDEDNKLCSAPVLLLHGITKGNGTRMCSGASLQNLLQPLPESMKISKSYVKANSIINAEEAKIKFSSDTKFQVIIPVSDETRLELERILQKSSALSLLQKEEKSGSPELPENEQNPQITTEIMMCTPCSVVPDRNEELRLSGKSKSSITRKPLAKPSIFKLDSKEIDGIGDEENVNKMNKLWTKQRLNLFKLMQVSTKQPEYYQQVPSLNYVKLRASELRREYLEKMKLKQLEYQQRLQNTALHSTRPKMNKSFLLRVKHKKNQPIITGHFDEHFEKYKKPPFNGDSYFFSSGFFSNDIDHF
jgi:hypothetical protein